MKVLLWLLLIVLVIAAIKKKILAAQKGAEPAARNPDANEDLKTGSRSAEITAETMLCCQVCQLYIPASEAVRKGQQVFCSAEHANL